MEMPPYIVIAESIVFVQICFVNNKNILFNKLLINANKIKYFLCIQYKTFVLRVY